MEKGGGGDGATGVEGVFLLLAYRANLSGGE